jgi:phosphoserine phosphatase
MGAMPLQRPPRDVETTLAPGDMLVLLSDGIYEFEDARGQAYGRSRAEAVVARHAAQGCAATAEALLADVQAFAEGAPQADDITVVLVQRQV